MRIAGSKPSGIETSSYEEGSFRSGSSKIEAFRLGAGTGFATPAAGFALLSFTAAAISRKAVFGLGTAFGAAFGPAFGPASSSRATASGSGLPAADLRTLETS